MGDQGESTGGPRGCYEHFTAFVDHLDSVSLLLPVYNYLIGMDGLIPVDSDERGFRLVQAMDSWIP